MPPNSEVCLGDDHTSGGHAPTSSRHPGGAHVLMSDGSVVFMTDSIEAGDDHAHVVSFGGSGATAPGSASPYGLWGALRTRAAREQIDQEIQ